jgi:hypothetical protein
LEQKNAIYQNKNEGWAWQAHRQKHRRYLLSQLNDFEITQENRELDDQEILE